MKNRNKLLIAAGIPTFSFISSKIYKQYRKYTYEASAPDLSELTEPDIPEDWKHEFITANGMKFHYVTAGEGPLLLMLHGFPENWYSWKNQISLMSEKYKVIALDMRGYNLSDKPRAVASYKVENLVEDIRQIILNSGYEKATVISHDWGGIVAWWFAMTHPEMLEKLVVMNCPHPINFAKSLRKIRQLMKSWYAFLFQLPVVPEGIFLQDDFKLTEKLLMRTAAIKEKAFAEDDFRFMERSIKQPGSFTSMVNYYRAVLRFGLPAATSVIRTPTLLLWGEKDPVFMKGINRGIEKYVPNIKVRYISYSGHWVQREAYEEVNAMLKEFLYREW